MERCRVAREAAGRSQRAKIGKLQDVYVDVETDEPQFATVKGGFIGRHLTVVVR
jgi:dTDP-4-dehydrorhamnose 3,5-epimerase-like enzyme